MIEWSDERLAEAGLDRKELESLIRRLRRCADDLRTMGLKLYGDGSHGHLIHHSRPTHPGGNSADYEAILASISGHFDGGDW